MLLNCIRNYILTTLLLKVIESKVVSSFKLLNFTPKGKDDNIMKIIDKWFYIIYNSYYQHGNYKNDHPSLTVGGIFVFAVFSIIQLFIGIYEFLDGSYIYAGQAKRYAVLEPSPAKAIGLVGLAIVYMLFFYKKRHDTIYEEYKDDSYLNSKQAKYLAVGMIIFVYLLPFITPIIVHRFILHTP